MYISSTNCLKVCTTWVPNVSKHWTAQPSSGELIFGPSFDIPGAEFVVDVPLLGQDADDVEW